MPQNVPAFEFSDTAKQLRQFVYEFWCEHGRGPNLRAVHEGIGLDRRQIVQGYKELQLGIICVVDQDSVNVNLLKFQPFSSFPSQVEVWIDGRFHSYAGCALESVAIIADASPCEASSVRAGSPRSSVRRMASSIGMCTRPVPLSSQP